MTDEKKDEKVAEAKAPKTKEAKRDPLGPIGEDGLERYGVKVDG